MRRPRYVHDRATHNRRAAAEIVPHLMRRFEPGSVVDLGCGTGSWLAVFRGHGCHVLGLEGEFVEDDLLEIPREYVHVVDLESDVRAPGRFDLALCLEVAEHLSPTAGERLVELLAATSDVILFSAAVPGQGGDHHVNERWPAHWQRLFAERGYSCDDAIRWAFWENDSVDWWYRQNMFVARRSDGNAGPPLLPVVHPRLLEKKVRTIDDFCRGRVPLRTALLVFLRSVKNLLIRR